MTNTEDQKPVHISTTQNSYVSQVVYKRDYLRGESYIGEIVRKLETRVCEHTDKARNSEPCKSDSSEKLCSKSDSSEKLCSSFF